MIGLIGKKVGMTQVFDDSGSMMPVTVIKIEPNVVVAQRSVEKNGYTATVLGAVEGKPSRYAKPYTGQFKDKKPRKQVVEMRDFEMECQVGDTLGADVFKDLAYVDVVGTSKGKGYQGVMKRHNFGGGRNTHGSKFHRANGSTGMAATPSRVIKGTKMAGRMGGEKRTVQNLEIVRVDPENQMVLVKGAVPGRKNSFVVVQKAKKKK